MALNYKCYVDLNWLLGLWGTLLCVFVLYPLAYSMPGPDHGCIENPFNTVAMIRNSTAIQEMFVLYFVSVFAYNVLGVLVTCILNSVWHAILGTLDTQACPSCLACGCISLVHVCLAVCIDNFRPVSVWGTDLFIFYAISRSFGEPWTKWSYLQLLGMFVLLYGTAIYNAPNQGSLLLRGQWFGCFLDYSVEYDELEMDDSKRDEVAQPLSFKSPLLTPKSARMTPTRGGYDSLEMRDTRPILSVQEARRNTMTK